VNNHYQMLVIGGGPAGLAAATIAANSGVSCALLDEQPAPGGQIYRAVEQAPELRAQLLGADYQRGKSLVENFRASRAVYFPNTSVWSVNEQREVGVNYQGDSRIITADHILIASGAMERPVPFTGWTLPGVMYAGSGQILFKSAGAIPEKGVVLAGSGPLLLLLAWQYMRAGVKIKAMLDMTPLGNRIMALPELPRALLAYQYLTKGMTLQRELKQAGVEIKNLVSDLRAEGDGQLERVCYRHRGREHTIETDLLMTHFGVIPHVWLTQAAGCRHLWNESQQCWHPQHDEWGATSIEGIFVAGDGAGIFGAKSAEYAGYLAGLQMSYAAGAVTRGERNQQAIVYRKAMKRDRHIRPFLESYFHIPREILAVQNNDTVVCRCEEITAGQIREAVANGHQDSNQVKYFTRCGMGPCQGRQCAQAVAHIVADAGGKSVSGQSCFRGRPPVTPLNLEQLAQMKRRQR